jgi:hypothetical protein
MPVEYTLARLRRADRRLTDFKRVGILFRPRKECANARNTENATLWTRCSRRQLRFNP